MRILLINHYAGSVYRGMEFRPYYLAREWAKTGNEVVIAAATYSHLRKSNPDIRRDFTEETVDGITYMWIKTPEYHGNGVERAVNMAAFCRKLSSHAAAIAEKYKPEAVIASSTYPFDSYPAAKIAKYARGKFYFEIHDLWPLTQIEIYGLNKNNPYVRLLQKAEDFSFGRARKVISILPQAYLHLEERGFSREKFVCVRNGVDMTCADKEKTSPAAEKAAELKKSGKFVVMYAGGFAAANAMDDFIGALPLLDSGVQLVLVGSGPQKRRLEERASQYKNVSFFDAVARDEVPGVLRFADCLYIGAKKCSLYRYGMGMNKLYDYMLAAKPIICGIDASNSEVADAGCGFVIEPQNPRTIAGAVRTLMDMSGAERAAMGERGHDYVVKHNDYAVLAKEYLDALK